MTAEVDANVPPGRAPRSLRLPEPYSSGLRSEAFLAGMRRSTEGYSRARAVLQLRRWCVAIGQPAAELGGHLPEDDDEIRRVDAIDANPPFGSLPNRPNNGSLYLLVREVDRVAGRQGLGRHRFAMKGR